MALPSNYSAARSPAGPMPHSPHKKFRIVANQSLLSSSAREWRYHAAGLGADTFGHRPPANASNRTMSGAGAFCGSIHRHHRRRFSGFVLLCRAQFTALFKHIGQGTGRLLIRSQVFVQYRRQVLARVIDDCFLCIAVAIVELGTGEITQAFRWQCIDRRLQQRVVCTVIDCQTIS